MVSTRPFLNQPDVIVFIRIEASGGELEESIYSKMETKMCLLVVFLVNGKCWKYHFRTLKLHLMRAVSLR